MLKQTILNEIITWTMKPVSQKYSTTN
jgi:hypothetical protein